MKPIITTAIITCIVTNVFWLCTLIESKTELQMQVAELREIQDADFVTLIAQAEGYDQ